jgi:hypothetical protein
VVPLVTNGKENNAQLRSKFWNEGACAIPKWIAGILFASSIVGIFASCFALALGR